MGSSSSSMEAVFAAIQLDQSHAIPEEAASKIWATYDTDGNGVLSPDEVRRFLKDYTDTVIEKAGPQSKVVDIRKEIADTFMTIFDVDGNGSLSWDEITGKAGLERTREIERRAREESHQRAKELFHAEQQRQGGLNLQKRKHARRASATIMAELRSKDQKDQKLSSKAIDEEVQKIIDEGERRDAGLLADALADQEQARRIAEIERVRQTEVEEREKNQQKVTSAVEAELASRLATDESEQRLLAKNVSNAFVLESQSEAFQIQWLKRNLPKHDPGSEFTPLERRLIKNTRLHLESQLKALIMANAEQKRLVDEINVARRIQAEERERNRIKIAQQVQDEQDSQTIALFSGENAEQRAKFRDLNLNVQAELQLRDENKEGKVDAKQVETLAAEFKAKSDPVVQKFEEHINNEGKYIVFDLESAQQHRANAEKTKEMFEAEQKRRVDEAESAKRLAAAKRDLARARAAAEARDEQTRRTWEEDEGLNSSKKEIARYVSLNFLLEGQSTAFQRKWVARNYANGSLPELTLEEEKELEQEQKELDEELRRMLNASERRAAAMEANRLADKEQRRRVAEAAQDKERRDNERKANQAKVNAAVEAERADRLNMEPEDEKAARAKAFKVAHAVQLEATTEAFRLRWCANNLPNHEPGKEFTEQEQKLIERTRLRLENQLEALVMADTEQKRLIEEIAAAKEAEEVDRRAARARIALEVQREQENQIREYYSGENAEKIKRIRHQSFSIITESQLRQKLADSSASVDMKQVEANVEALESERKELDETIDQRRATEGKKIVTQIDRKQRADTRRRSTMLASQLAEVERSRRLEENLAEKRAASEALAASRKEAQDKVSELVAQEQKERVNDDESNPAAAKHRRRQSSVIARNLVEEVESDEFQKKWIERNCAV